MVSTVRENYVGSDIGAHNVLSGINEHINWVIIHMETKFLK